MAAKSVFIAHIDERQTPFRAQTNYFENTAVPSDVKKPCYAQRCHWEKSAFIPRKFKIELLVFTYITILIFF